MVIKNSIIWKKYFQTFNIVLGKTEVKCAQFASVVSLIADKYKEQQNINSCRILANEFNLSAKQIEATLLITFCQLQNWVHVDDMFVNKVILFLCILYYIYNIFKNSI